MLNLLVSEKGREVRLDLTHPLPHGSTGPVSTAQVTALDSLSTLWLLDMKEEFDEASLPLLLCFALADPCMINRCTNVPTCIRC